jgi:hypothetical protein
LRILFSLFIAVACFDCSYGQSKERTDHIREAGSFKKDFLEKNSYPGEKIPFNRIIVYDYRYDSSKLGYLARVATGSAYSSIQSKHDWATNLNHYFRDILDPGSNRSLVFVIKTFWMQQGIIDETLNKKVVAKAAMERADQGGFCRAAIDVYIQTDSLTPYFQVEDSFLELFNFRPGNLEAFYYLPFDSIARRIKTTDPASLKKPKNRSLADVAAYYQKRTDLPILRDTITRRGIFRTFQDFKNNRPSEEKFKIRRSKLTDELYVVNGNEESLLIDFFGACDESGLYIKVGYGICTAVRSQNTFEVHGAKHISNYHNNPQQGELLRLNSMNLDRKILQLNMDTGIFY